MDSPVSRSCASGFDEAAVDEFRDGIMDALRTERFQGHLNACATCRSRLSAWSSMHALLDRQFEAALPAEESPVGGLAISDRSSLDLDTAHDRESFARIRSEVRELLERKESTPQGRRAALRLWPGWMAAAAAAAAIVLAVLLRREQGPPSVAQLATLSSEAVRERVRSIVDAHPELLAGRSRSGDGRRTVLAVASGEHSSPLELLSSSHGGEILLVPDADVLQAAIHELSAAGYRLKDDNGDGVPDRVLRTDAPEYEITVALLGRDEGEGLAGARALFRDLRELEVEGIARPSAQSQTGERALFLRLEVERPTLARVLAWTAQAGLNNAFPFVDAHVGWRLAPGEQCVPPLAPCFERGQDGGFFYEVQFRRLGEQEVPIFAADLDRLYRMNHGSIESVEVDFVPYPRPLRVDPDALLLMVCVDQDRLDRMEQAVAELRACATREAVEQVAARLRDVDRSVLLWHADD